MKNNVLKIGIVGTGFISQVAHIPNFYFIDNCQIQSIAEIRPRLRAKISQRYEIESNYSTHQELLTHSDVDAIVVITPRNMTGPVAHDCLKAGKHVFTEKPMAGDHCQAKKLVQESKKNNVKYVVGFMRRFDNGVLYAKKLINHLTTTKELGQISYVRVHCFQGEDYCNIDGFIDTGETKIEKFNSWPEYPQWLPDKYHQNYKRFLNVFCHNINLIRFLLDKKLTVEYARMVPENGRLIIFDCGEFACSLEAGNFTYQGWDEIVEIFFQHGRLRIKLPPALLKNVPASVELYRGDEHTFSVPHLGWSWAFKNQAEAFINDILCDQLSVNTGEDALLDMQLIENIWEKLL